MTKMKKLLLLVIALVLASTFAIAGAEEPADERTLTEQDKFVDGLEVSLVGSITLKGTPPETKEEYTLTLTPAEASFPMPAGTKDGKYTKAVQAESYNKSGATVIDYTLDPLVYDNVGIFTYTLTQKGPEGGKGTYDKTTYTLKVTVHREKDEKGEEGLMASVALYQGEIDITKNKVSSADFENTYSVETKTLTVEKVWNDANNQDGYRPTTLSVTLSHGSEKTDFPKITDITLSKDYGVDVEKDEKSNTWTANENQKGKPWTANVYKVPVFEDDTRVKIEYSWTEALTDTDKQYYTEEAQITEKNTTILTNRHDPEKTDITLTKVWADEMDTSERPSTEEFLKKITLYAKDAAEKTVDTVKIPEPELKEEEGGQNWTITWKDLPVNAPVTSEASARTPVVYSITEAEVSSLYENGTITQTNRNDPYKFTVTNTRRTGSLRVQKTVSSTTGRDQNLDFAFTVKVNKPINGVFGGMTFEADADGKGATATFNLKHNGNITATGLPIGMEYTVTEAAKGEEGYIEGFVTTYTGNKGTITEDSGRQADIKTIASFTNTRDEGGIVLSKKVESDLTADQTRDYTFTLKLSEELTENYPVSGVARIRNVAFQNGEATVTLRHGETLSISGMPTTNTITITEAEEEDFITTLAVDGGEEKEARATDALAIKDEEAASVVFTNTRKTGELTISKTVDSRVPADETREFIFELKLTNGTQVLDKAYPVKDEASGLAKIVPFGDGSYHVTVAAGTPVTISGLPVGAAYSVKEILTADESEIYEQTEVAGTEGTISETPAAADFENARKTGGLTVTKTINASTEKFKEQKFTFTVKLSDDTINGKFGGMTFDKGIATFSLADGEEVTAEALPAGVTYTVTEADVEYFENTKKTGDTGTITAGETKTAAFTNTRKEGSLRLTKKVESILEADKTREFSFTIQILEAGKVDAAIDGEYGEITFEKGIATVPLIGGASLQADNLPEGHTYTIVEKVPEEFTSAVTAGSEEGTISGKTRQEATFTNTRKTGSLIIRKTLEMSDVMQKYSEEEAEKYDDLRDQFDFQVELSYTEDGETQALSGEIGGIEFTDGKATVQVYGVRAGYGTTELTDIPAGTEWTVTEVLRETAAANQTILYVENKPQEGTIQLDEESEAETSSAEFTNTRLLGHVTVDKETSAITTPDGEARAEGERAQLGDTITYAITVTNDGELDIYEMELSDKVNEHDAEDLTEKLTAAIQELHTGNARLAPGEKVTVRYDYIVTEEDIESGALIHNVATAKGKTDDPKDPEVPDDPGENEEPIKSVDVQKTLTAIERDGEQIKDLSSVRAGDIITYTVTVTNNGQVVIPAGMKITDTLTRTLKPEEGEEAKTEEIQTELATTKDLGLADDEDTESSEELTYTYTVQANDLHLSNAAIPEISIPTPPPVDEPIESVKLAKTMTKVVRGGAEITAAEGMSVQAGDVLTYTITATNTGEVEITNLPVHDILTVTKKDGTSSESKRDLTIASVPVGGTGTQSYEYIVTDDDKSLNNAVVSDIPGEDPPPPVVDPVEGLKMEKALTKVVRGEEELTVTEGMSVQAGDVLTYTITATNTGDADLTNVTVHEKMTVTRKDDTEAVTETNLTIDSIPVGGSGTAEYTYTVTANDKKLSNAVTSDIPGEKDPPEVEDPVEGVRLAKALTRVVRGGENVPVTAGMAVQADDVLTYTITATNTGDAELKDLKIHDTMTVTKRDNSTTVIETELTIASVPVGGSGTAEYTYTVAEEDQSLSNAVTSDIPGENDPPEVIIRVDGVNITVAKNWNDNNNALGIRPAAINMTLLANGTANRTVTLTAANNWRMTVENLPRNDADGNAIAYTWRETPVPGYRQTAAVTNAANNTTTFTNTPVNLLTIIDYETPLGLGVTQNQAGESYE